MGWEQVHGLAQEFRQACRAAGALARREQAHGLAREFRPARRTADALAPWEQAHGLAQEFRPARRAAEAHAGWERQAHGLAEICVAVCQKVQLQCKSRACLCTVWACIVKSC